MHIRRTAVWITTLAVAAGSLTCKSDISDPDPEPAALIKSAGDDQVGLVNETLPDSLVVTVQDAQGQPLAGVAVHWAVTGAEREPLTGRQRGRRQVRRGPAAGQRRRCCHHDGHG